MSLKQTRQALVDEFVKKRFYTAHDPVNDNQTIYGYKKGNLSELLTQALNDYTESIVSMVEGMEMCDMGRSRSIINDNYAYRTPNNPETKAYNKALNDIKEALGE